MYLEIIEIFGINEENQINDEFIESHADPMWEITDFEPIKYLPSYMVWCVRNGNRDGNLVCAGTINAIAESGRSRSPNITHLNFKYRCTEQQKLIVARFLIWCLYNLSYEDENQIKRSIKQWYSS